MSAFDAVSTGANLYPAANALAAVFRGGPVNLDSLSVDEEVGFLLLAQAVRRLARGE